MQTDPNLKPLKYDDVEVEHWVITLYEDEKFIGKVMKKREWEFNRKTKKSFIENCFRQNLRHHSVTRMKPYCLYHTCTKRIKLPIKHKWMKKGRKGESSSGYIDRKLFGLMNCVVIENLDIVNVKFKTFHVMEQFQLCYIIHLIRFSIIILTTESNLQMSVNICSSIGTFPISNVVRPV